MGAKIFQISPKLSIEDTASVRKVFLSIAVLQAYACHRHAFTLGCGRGTMLYWVSHETPEGKRLKNLGINVTSGDVRRCLMNLVELGYFTKIQNEIGYSTFSETSNKSNDMGEVDPAGCDSDKCLLPEKQPS